MFRLELDRLPAGAVARQEGDGAAARLKAAEPYVRSDCEELRRRGAKQLRDVAERFCKELAVKKRRESGDELALISDYTGKTLGQLIPTAHQFLTKPDEPGKLDAIRNGLNPAAHDAPPPDKGTLAVCFGDLRKFIKDYL